MGALLGLIARENGRGVTYRKIHRYGCSSRSRSTFIAGFIKLLVNASLCSTDKSRQEEEVGSNIKSPAVVIVILNTHTHTHVCIGRDGRKSQEKTTDMQPPAPLSFNININRLCFCTAFHGRRLERMEWSEMQQELANQTVNMGSRGAKGAAVSHKTIYESEQQIIKKSDSKCLQ